MATAPASADPRGPPSGGCHSHAGHRGAGGEDRGSLFGAAPRRPLDREQRARFRYLLHAHRRAGRLTRAGQDVGEALVKRLGTDGQCDPAHATLAADAGCCERTVRTATSAMRAIGLLRWQTRLIRTDGWRAAQTSNAYELVATAALPALSIRCGGKSCRETQEIEIQTMPTSADVRAAQAALARVAAQRLAAIQGRLLLNKSGWPVGAT